MSAARAAFAAEAAARASEVVGITQRLVAVPSPNPPGDVRDAAECAAALLRELVPEAEVTLHPTDAAVTNLVARVTGAGPGRRVVFNGHLDTYPVNEALPWTVPPLGGLVRDGRLIHLTAEIPDKPGALADLTRAVGALGGNIVEVQHQRFFTALPANVAAVELIVEAQDEAHGERLVEGLTARGMRTVRRNV